MRESVLLAGLLAAAGCAGSRPGPPPEPAPAVQAPAPAAVPAAPPVPESRPSEPPAPGEDSLLLQGADRELPVRVIRLAGGVLELALKRDLLSLVARNEAEGSEYPDAVLAPGLRVVVRCRVLAEEAGELRLALPWAQVDRLERTRGPRRPAAAGAPTGTLAGVVTVRGRPSSGARVRAVRLSGRTLVPGVLEAPPLLEAAEEAIADDEGRFRFDAIQAGSYKLWVQPRGEEAWLRRIGLVPDIYVPPGERVEMPPFDIKTVADS